MIHYMPKTFLCAMALATTSAFANEINVLTAWYGQSCGTAHGNVTSHVKSTCDRQATCNYKIDVVLLGDTTPGCAKNFLVLFACKNQQNARLAQLPGEASGKSILLSCTAN